MADEKTMEQVHRSRRKALARLMGLRWSDLPRKTINISKRGQQGTVMVIPPMPESLRDAVFTPRASRSNHPNQVV